MEAPAQKGNGLNQVAEAEPSGLRTSRVNMAPAIQHVVIDMHVERIGGVQKRWDSAGRSGRGNPVAGDKPCFIRIDAPQAGENDAARIEWLRHKLSQGRRPFTAKGPQDHPVKVAGR